MKKKTIILTILLIIGVGLRGEVMAVDQEMFIPTNGDSEGYAVAIGDQQLNHYWVYEEVVIPSGGATGVTIPKGTSQILYDVNVQVQKEEYEPKDKVKATIMIKNMGDLPDKDAILTYFLTDPFNQTCGLATEYIIEAPPITYDKYNCERLNGQIVDGQCITILEREVYLYEDSVEGEWIFNVHYFTEYQGLLTARDTFVVVDNENFEYTIMGISAFFIFSMLFIGYRKRKKRFLSW